MLGEKIMMISMAIGMSLAPASNLVTPLASDVSIDNTNVAYDLKLLYGGDNPVSFDIGTLQPTGSDYDPYFAFYCMYPYDTSLYLYLYDYNANNYDFYDTSLFAISKSTVQNADATFNEEWVTYEGWFINSYGYRGRFAKFRIDDILDPTTPERVAIGGAEIRYSDSLGQMTSVSRDINDEMDIDQTSGVDDFVYDYYHDDYVKVTDSTLALLLTPTEDKDKMKSSLSGYGYYQEYYEDFYYFFSVDDDHKMDDLIEVKYDYTYISYDAYAFEEGSSLSKNKKVAYKGLYDSNNTVDLTGYDNEELGKAWQVLLSPVISGALNSTNHKYDETLLKSTVQSTEYRVENRKNVPIYRDAVDAQSFWRKKTVSYTLNSIIDLSDGYDYSSGEYWNQTSFSDAVQTLQTDNGGEPYEWAFLVASDVRELTDWEKQSGSEWYSHTDCHECIDTILTWLHYRTNDVDFRLNALSDPTSTEVVYIDDDVFYDTLGDQFITFFNSIGSTVKNVFKWIGIICGAVAVVIVIILIIRWARKRKHNNDIKKAYNTGSSGSTCKSVQKGKTNKSSSASASKKDSSKLSNSSKQSNNKKGK